MLVESGCTLIATQFFLQVDDNGYFFLVTQSGKICTNFLPLFYKACAELFWQISNHLVQNTQNHFTEIKKPIIAPPIFHAFHRV